MDLREVRVQTGGRTDPDIAREILVLGGVDARAHRRRGWTPSRRRSSRATPSSSPTTSRTGSRPARPTSSRRSPTTRDAPVARDRQRRGRRAAEAPRRRASAGTSRPGRAGSAPTRADRADLPPVARARAGRAWNGDAPWPRERTVVIGDTPRDIACARADGVHVVAVADRAVRRRGPGRRRRAARVAAGPAGRARGARARLTLRRRAASRSRRSRRGPRRRRGRAARARARGEMSQTTATSRVASGVPVQARTSSTEVGGSRRSVPGTRFARITS